MKKKNLPNKPQPFKNKDWSTYVNYNTSPMRASKKQKKNTPKGTFTPTKL